MQQTYLILGSSLGATSSINLSSADYSFIGENLADIAGVAERIDNIRLLSEVQYH